MWAFQIGKFQLILGDFCSVFKEISLNSNRKINKLGFSVRIYLPLPGFGGGERALAPAMMASREPRGSHGGDEFFC